MDFLVKIGLAFLFSGLLFLLFTIFLKIKQKEIVFNDMLFVESGQLPYYKNSYYDYDYVNVRKRDGSLSSRPKDLEILTIELKQYQKIAREYPGFTSDKWFDIEQELIHNYNQQDRRAMIDILSAKEIEEFPLTNLH